MEIKNHILKLPAFNYLNYIYFLLQNSVDIKVLEDEVRKLQYVHNLSDYNFHEILDIIRDFVDVYYNIVSLKNPRVIKSFKFAGNVNII